MKRTPNLSTAVWRKSSYSDGGGTNCLEVADGYPDLVPVRDSKVPDGRALVFGTAAWSAFLTHAARSA
ncbi:DUF397 domain-containing protein [Streptomyces sp. NPDC058676]|uniref:DUF397 domain-containing protein n=1 Tax=unclassified Streptomyces TaxID=2593676 RepID=UPI0036518531